MKRILSEEERTEAFRPLESIIKVKIAFLIEYFPPFAPGGAEWSAYYLAKDLAKKKDIEVFVLTPNYGDSSYEKKEGIEIFRFPFYKKLKKNSPALTYFYYINPIWFFWTAYQIFKFAKKNNIDILHVQGKFSIPPARLANFFMRRKILVTIRDYIVICNYGFCLFHKDKACSIFEYFNHDFVYYLRNYVKSTNPLIIFLNLLFAIWGRFTTKLFKLSLKGLKIIVLSNKQKAIFAVNGLENVEVIGNSIDFPKNSPTTKKKNRVVYAGRLTIGKGISVLIELLPDFFKKFPNFEFFFIGEGPLKEDLRKLARKNKGIKVTGQIPHNHLINHYRQARLAVVPSLWPEPFGRSAIEALSQVTPVVVSNRGALPEIIKDQKWGIVVNPDGHDLIAGIEKALKNFPKLHSNIKKDYEQIRKKFGSDVERKYLDLYQKL